MKQISTLCMITCFTLFLGCKKDIPEVDEAEVLKERFHGKYKILLAMSDQAVDINMDGVASHDLLAEIPNLNNSYLELIFRDDVNLFALFWQEQYLSYEYDKNNPFVMYANQSYPLTFSINPQRTQLIVAASRDITENDSSRYVIPTTVRIEEDDHLRASFTKRIYTKQGFKDITVELLYERWTSET